MRLAVTLEAARLVRAPRAAVWRAFCELTGWDDWGRPGAAGAGPRLVLGVGPLGLTARARGRVLVVREGLEVGWRGRALGITSRQHYRFVDQPRGTLMEFREELEGWALLLTRPFYSPRRQSGLGQAWLAQLAARAEGPGAFSRRA